CQPGCCQNLITAARPPRWERRVAPEAPGNAAVGMTHSAAGGHLQLETEHPSMPICPPVRRPCWRKTCFAQLAASGHEHASLARTKPRRVWCPHCAATASPRLAPVLVCGRRGLARVASTSAARYVGRDLVPIRKRRRERERWAAFATPAG